MLLLVLFLLSIFTKLCSGNNSTQQEHFLEKKIHHIDIPPIQHACSSHGVSNGIWVKNSSITEKLY